MQNVNFDANCQFRIKIQTDTKYDLIQKVMIQMFSFKSQSDSNSELIQNVNFYTLSILIQNVKLIQKVKFDTNCQC